MLQFSAEAELLEFLDDVYSKVHRLCDLLSNGSEEDVNARMSIERARCLADDLRDLENLKRISEKFRGKPR